MGVGVGGGRAYLNKSFTSVWLHFHIQFPPRVLWNTRVGSFNRLAADSVATAVSKMLKETKIKLIRSCSNTQTLQENYCQQLGLFLALTAVTAPSAGLKKTKTLSAPPSPTPPDPAPLFPARCSPGQSVLPWHSVSEPKGRSIYNLEVQAREKKKDSSNTSYITPL